MYANLGSAIVVKAIEDTVRAMQGKLPEGVTGNKKLFDFQGEIQSNYRFFKSDFFKLLTDLDGGKLVKMFEENRELIKQTKGNKISKIFDEIRRQS